MQSSLEDQYRTLIQKAKEHPDEIELRSRSVTKSDYTPKRHTKQQPLMSPFEWLIVLLLALLILLFSWNAQVENTQPKIIFCDSGLPYFTPVNCEGNSCRKQECRQCPLLGSCNHGKLAVSS